MPTFKKFNRRKLEKSELMFPSFASLWRHTTSRRPRAHAYQRPTGWCVRNWTPCLLTFQCLLSRVTFAQIFSKLAPSRDFETSLRAVKTTVSTSRQTKSDTPPLLPPLHLIWPVLGPGGDNESDAITFMFFKYQNNIRQSPDQKILVGS